ncbi:hypothetical protein GCM10011351_07110 [Paraliobacillus quinghaiensis]|uniref:AB hydrolase-1 domain-containing protein n=1 Tax=Paraliobacillus quinghaiensis TaxID=470815 RepID=A0A917THR5_9BACI|nr:alpha/beta hydrolase [Paraliobacillus quinghaiensis]GGM23900.1 hypothetical protein GCM10011351_07110 [Paraliobacillus quinghaiensis]
MKNNASDESRKGGMLKKRVISLLLITIVIFLVYAFIRPILIHFGLASTIELTIAIILLFIFIITIIILLIKSLLMTFKLLIKKKRPEWKPIKSQLLYAGYILTVLFLMIITSQWFAYTPSVKGDDGKVIENSIASLEQISLNNSKQWISIRSHDEKNPVLLFLAGGPGGTQMAATREQLSELERQFTIVNWDQPGSGKSYHAVDLEDLTPERYIKDAQQLTLYLRDRFKQDKIYVMGESWGSALGIMLVNEYPKLYHAFIGTGQMVDFKETEEIDYELAKQIATDSGDTEKVLELEEQGPPPYYGKDVVWKESAYLMYLSDYMAKDPNIINGGYNTIGDILGPEYGLYDKLNFLRGVAYTFNHVYQQLYEVDLRKQAVKLDVPVYFLIGRHDINAPISITEEYFGMIEAPEKELIWFEHSGHSPWINETDKFVNTVVDCFLN